MTFIEPASAIEPLTRQPYVQNLGTTHVTIMWRTAVPTAQKIEYGFENRFVFAAAETTRTTHHEMTLRDLIPGQTYSYRITENDLDLRPGKTFSFTTDAGRGDADFSFFVAGDVGVDKNPRQHFTQAAIRSVFPPADFGLIPGDVVYPDGSSARYDAQLMGPWADLLATTPVWPVLGNHDWRTDPAENFEVEWSLPGNEHYYSFDYANAHIIALDTGPGKFWDEDNQLAWLENDLATPRDARWTFVFFHHPLITCTYKGNEPKMAAKVLPLFERYGVDVLFTGHAHTFERLYPIVDGQPVDQEQDPFYADPQGPIHIVSGCGGKIKSNRPTSFCGPTAAFVDEQILFTQVVARNQTLYLVTINSETRTAVDAASIWKSRTTSAVELVTPPRRLLQNVPNPFNPTTTIPFVLARPASVRMSVYRSDGTWITNLAHRVFASGSHRVVWNGFDHSGQRVPSGLYVVKMQSNGESEAIKMMLVR